MKLPMPPSKLLKLLDDLAESVEEILLTGLTAASDSTRQTLAVAFQEASRMRLLRLGSTLRVASEEIGRFAQNDDKFSAKRLAFFLNRAWMLSRGMSHAIRNKDEEQWSSLTWSPGGKPFGEVDVVTLGVSKRVVPGAFCAFEFRLRTLSDTEGLPAGSKALWSCVFPMKVDAGVGPEAFLLLSQKQKFKGQDFLENKVIHIENAVLIDGNTPRINLVDNSTVKLGDEFTEWEQFLNWDQASAFARIREHEPGPFDLDVELQEELVLTDWTVAEPEQNDQLLFYLIESDGIRYHAQVSESDAVLRKAMDQFVASKKTLPPVYALMHFEMCKLVLQPLSVFKDGAPAHIGISREKAGAAALLRTMKF